MKKRWRWLIPLVALIALVCVAMGLLRRWQPKLPERAADGSAWDEGWVTLGAALGVEAPGDGFALLDNNSILTADDTYLASWASGSPTPYTNADGDDVELYEAQIYLLLQGCKDAENAEAAIDDWLAREQETYAVRETRTENHGNQEYTILVYDVNSDENPYARGATAFARRGNYALTAEISCTEEFTGDAASILGEFLDGFHYSAAI